ncbi:MAG TPA: Rha family transcriptional regulator [Planctomycetota bacterium]|nr:Rha family transcriptional regulator [Planctomycetota bacterium]
MTGAVRTMDSREIAELTGKQHAHVCRDIEAQLGALGGGVSRFGDTYRNPQNGQTYRCYRLPYRETMILVSGYSVELRARVVDRWMELERGAAVPKTFAEALRLAADLEEQRAALEAKVEADAPKVEAAEALMTSERTLSITEAARSFGLHPRRQVFPYLREHGYLTTGDMPTMAAVEAGYLSMRSVMLPDHSIRQQAVVLVNQLDTWRTRVVPQVIAWIGGAA